MSQTEGVSALVTGGSGFIGTWVLRELLAAGVQPIAYDLQPHPERWRRVLGASADRVQFVQGSLLEREKLAAVCDEHRVRHLIHLAALLTPACQADPWTGCEVNVMGTVAVFELARQRADRIGGVSYASSYAVYGPEADDAVASSATADDGPPMFYGAFKKAADMIADQYWRHFRVPSIGIRPHVVYGPEREQGLTASPSLAARAAAHGEASTIGYTGRVGYDYVEDVARAFVRGALNTPSGHHLVDLPGEVATTEQFAAAIEAAVPALRGRITVAGPPIPSNVPPTPHYISELFTDWKATSLADGVRKMVEFYRA